MEGLKAPAIIYSYIPARHLSLVRSRLSWRHFIRVVAVLVFIALFLALLPYSLPKPHVSLEISRPAPPPEIDSGNAKVRPPLPPSKIPPVPCFGPRGKAIRGSKEDQLWPRKLKAPYPTPFTGSYEALGLPQEWLTLEERYAPYGFGSTRPTVEWSQVDWGELQHACQLQNAGRFGPGGQVPFNVSDVRFHLRPEEDDLRSWFADLRARLGFPVGSSYSIPDTGRTALLLRTHDRYKYSEEDLLNLRSIVSEAALQSGGEYTVVLLVNVRNAVKSDIWASPAKYQQAIENANIPAEFRHLVVLWDETLVASWYPKIGEYGVFWQITQAMQLFTLFYPEFDFSWQLEMDMRSLGHTLQLLRAMDDFSRREPRKQSWERASFMFLPEDHGSWESFVGAVNASLDGGASVWGPVPIPEIPHPIGPRPPVADARDDEFEWGVGEPADLIVTNPCAWVPRMRTWPFRFWFKGPFSQKMETPRMTCPTAVQRASRQLLLAVHEAQIQMGLAVPSEATLPSFAVWHGLKVSSPPLPHFRAEPMNARTKQVWLNGGQPGECVKLTTRPDNANAAAELEAELHAFLGDEDEGRWNEGDLETISFTDLVPLPLYKGFACGESTLNWVSRASMTGSLSWWWEGRFPRRLFKIWSKGTWTGRAGDGHELPAADVYGESAGVLVEEDGEIWAPAAWLHPVKTQ